MKNWLNNYFGFTKQEYNGLLVLTTILLVVSVLPYFYDYFASPTQETSLNEQTALQKLVLVNAQQPNNFATMRAQIEDRESSNHTTLFKFDPNQLDLAGWQQLGLSQKQAQSILNYRNKGGKFYQPADLQKMYTITPKKYEELAPYIEIDNAVVGKQQSKTYSNQSGFAKKEQVNIELNSADTLQLDEIKGVGAAFARRIAKYRERLGGFYKKEQLLEVYGLDSAKFNEIKDQVMVNANDIRKININTAEFEELKNHPYLKYKQINAIIQYRKQHGRYNDMEDLKKVIILDAQTIQRIMPYLIF